MQKDTIVATEEPITNELSAGWKSVYRAMAVEVAL